MPIRMLLALGALAIAGNAHGADVASAWVFESPSSPSLHRPAIDAEGTAFVTDGDGRLYAIDRRGAARWTYDAARTGGLAGGGAEGPVALGADGTVYFAFNPVGPLVEVHAVSSEGTGRWVFRLAGRSTLAGPAVGPDGNVYVAHAESGRGLLVLGPDGQLVRSSPGTPALQDRSSLGSELVFGPRAPGEPPTQLYLALDMYNQQQRNPSPSLFGFELSGQQRFRSDVGKLAIAGGQRQGQPVVGPSGTVYVSTTSTGQGWGVHAFSPGDGRPRWSWYEVPGNTLSEPAAGPDETIYVVQNTGRLVALSPEGEARWAADLQGFFAHGPVIHPGGAFVALVGERGDETVVQALDALSGATLWELHLPRAEGERLAPLARVVFAPDGSRLFVQTEVMGPEGSEGWRLFALDVVPCPTGSTDCSTRTPPAPARGPDAPPLSPTLAESATGASSDVEANEAEGRSSVARSGCNAAGSVSTPGLLWPVFLVAARRRKPAAQR